MDKDDTHHQEAEAIADEVIAQEPNTELDALADAEVSDDAIVDTFSDPEKVDAKTAVASALGALHTRPDQTDIQAEIESQLAQEATMADEFVPAPIPAELNAVPSNEQTVYAIPYYTTPEGKVRVAFDRSGGMIGFPELSSIVMEEHMQLQPLTNETNTALSVNLGTHTNAPPLQAASDSERIWLDADTITRVAGGLPSLDPSKPTPGYTATKDGESFILSPDQSAVMDAAINRLDEAQQNHSGNVKVNIKIASQSDTPTNVAQALQAQHVSTLAPNATDLAASVA